MNLAMDYKKEKEYTKKKGSEDRSLFTHYQYDNYFFFAGANCSFCNAETRFAKRPILRRAVLA